MSGEKPTIGFILSLIGGCLVLICSAIILAAVPFAVTQAITMVPSVMPSEAEATVEAVKGLITTAVYGLFTFGLVSGVLVIIGGLLGYLKGKTTLGGILSIVFGLLSIAGGGGFLIGLILSIIGGALLIAKK